MSQIDLRKNGANNRPSLDVKWSSLTPVKGTIFRTLPTESLSSSMELCARFLNRKMMTQKEMMEKIVLPITTGESKWSGRLLEWTAANFGKKRHVVLVSDQGIPISVSKSYKKQLKRFSSSGFSIVKRGMKIFFLHQEQVISTTVAQLNFIWWSHSIGLFTFLKENLEDVKTHKANEAAIKRKMKKEEKEGPPTKRRKKEEEVEMTNLFKINNVLKFD